MSRRQCAPNQVLILRDILRRDGVAESSALMDVGAGSSVLFSLPWPLLNAAARPFRAVLPSDRLQQSSSAGIPPSLPPSPRSASLRECASWCSFPQLLSGAPLPLAAV